MTELVFLQDLVVILTAAVVVVALLRRLQVPAIAGFIVAGTAVGPHALGLVQDLQQVEILAELGVVLLLFGIGLELSLDRVRQLWRLIAVGGGMQVAATVLVVLGLSLLLGRDAQSGLVLGFIIAISSTAIVLRGLSTRGELEAPHGRLTLGILVFQDLCVVPMVLVIPFLADTDLGTSVWVPLLTAAVVVAGALVAARIVVPRFLDAVARTRQRELFVLSVFLICLGTAWAVSSAGVSLALGAFLAGLVVSGSRYREQAISDLVPRSPRRPAGPAPDSGAVRGHHHREVHHRLPRRLCHEAPPACGSPDRRRLGPGRGVFLRSPSGDQRNRPARGTTQRQSHGGDHSFDAGHAVRARARAPLGERLG